MPLSICERLGIRPGTNRNQVDQEPPGITSIPTTQPLSKRLLRRQPRVAQQLQHDFLPRRKLKMLPFHLGQLYRSVGRIMDVGKVSIFQMSLLPPKSPTGPISVCTHTQLPRIPQRRAY